VKLSDQVLIGWLVMMRHAYENDVSAILPPLVIAELQMRGWLAPFEGTDWDGKTFCDITPAGEALIDLNGAEYGMQTLEEA
jgi:hypothetical protein